MPRPIFTTTGGTGGNGGIVALSSTATLSRKADGSGPVVGQRLLQSDILPSTRNLVVSFSQPYGPVLLLNELSNTGLGTSPGIKSDDTSGTSANNSIGTVFSDVEQGLMFYSPSTGNLGTNRLLALGVGIGFTAGTSGNPGTYFRLMSPSGLNNLSDPWSRNSSFDFFAILNTPVPQNLMTVFGVSRRSQNNFSSIGLMSNKISVRTQLQGETIQDWQSHQSIAAGATHLINVWSDGQRYGIRINGIEQRVNGSGSPVFRSFFPTGAGRNHVTLGAIDNGWGINQQLSGLLGEIRLYSPGLTWVNRNNINKSMMADWSITQGTNIA